MFISFIQERSSSAFQRYLYSRDIKTRTSEYTLHRYLMRILRRVQTLSCHPVAKNRLVSRNTQEVKEN